MVNYKPKCLAIPLIHTKIPEISTNETKYKQISCELFFLHEENWNYFVQDEFRKFHFPERRNYICKETKSVKLTILSGVLK